MPRKLVEKVIGGRRYKIRQLGSVTQDAIVIRFILGGAQSTLGVSDVDGAKEALMAETQVEIVDEASPSDVKPRSFVPLSSVYDDLLANDMKGRMQWLAAAVEVSFGNFSDALAELYAMRKALLSSISQKTHAGPSTDSSSAAA